MAKDEKILNVQPHSEEAELAVSATRYPPLGIRGVAGLVRASNYGRYTDYFEDVNNERHAVWVRPRWRATEKFIFIS